MMLRLVADLHYDFINNLNNIKVLNGLGKPHKSQQIDGIILIGDIANYFDLKITLNIIADSCKVPIYFVLGNHDYYGSGIKETKQLAVEISKKTKGRKKIIYLSDDMIYPLTNSSCLIGQDLFYDTLAGNYFGSSVQLSDFFCIKDLKVRDKRLMYQLIIQPLLSEELAQLNKKILFAIKRNYTSILIVTHFPIFIENCTYKGKISDDDWLPYFCCKSAGRLISEYAKLHPKVNFIVMSGHTHEFTHKKILPNLLSRTLYAKYGEPNLDYVIRVDNED